MPTYNYKSRELIAKIVYYGPGRCGKTTNLQQVHARMRPETRSELLSVATETDRTIYFDLLPLNLGTISGMKFMVRLFTVPGQVYYSETRKLVLKGADGVVFVADSQDHMLDENRQSLRDLKENLAANGIDYKSIPLVLQWNKRDLPHLVSEAELDATLNDRGVKAISSVASEGTGVLETLRHITLGVFNHIKAGGQVGGIKRPASAPRAASKIPSFGSHPAAGLKSPRPSTPAPAQGPLSSPAAAPASSAEAFARSPSGASQPLALGPTSSSSVQPGSWSASIPKTSLDGSKPKSDPRSRPNHEPPGPVRISQDLFVEEFKNLAVMHSQLAERISALESQVTRLGRENQEIKEILARQSRA